MPLRPYGVGRACTVASAFHIGKAWTLNLTITITITITLAITITAHARPPSSMRFSEAIDHIPHDFKRGFSEKIIPSCSPCAHREQSGSTPISELKP